MFPGTTGSYNVICTYSLLPLIFFCSRGLFDVKFNQFNSNILPCRTLIAAASHFDIISCRAGEISREPGR